MNSVRILIRTCQFAVLAVGAAAAVTTPVRIEQTVEPHFPAALAFSPISSGEAHVIINVDYQGSLVDLLVTSYTDKAFADEAVGLLKLWRYRAATVNGEPVGVRMELRLEFSAKGRVVSLSAIDMASGFVESMGLRPAVTNVCKSSELDQPLAAVQAVARLNPAEVMAPSGTANSVILDFYVDEKGQPRMPVVLDSPSTALSQAAVGALNQCRFTAPTRGGKPVLVRAQQKFVFTQSS
jgi:outer membrane biosynthesis protein TonB